MTIARGPGTWLGFGTCSALKTRSTAGWVSLPPLPNCLSTAGGAREAQREHSPLLLVEFAPTSLACGVGGYRLSFPCTPSSAGSPPNWGGRGGGAWGVAGGRVGCGGVVELGVWPRGKGGSGAWFKVGVVSWGEAGVRVGCERCGWRLSLCWAWVGQAV